MTELQLINALGQTATDKRVEILRLIASSGSISQAARDAGVSYKAAWQAIDTLSNLARVPLVEKAIGGAGGGGARLTDAGRRLLTTAHALDQARQLVLGSGDGLTPVGALALRTSMRNQIPCVVTCIQPRGRMVQVVMGIGRTGIEKSDEGPAQLVSRITSESAQLLGLVPGLSVLALFKATAARVVPGATQLVSIDQNVLFGTIKRLARAADSAESDEYSVSLVGGMQVAGFGAAGERLQKKSEVKVCVDETAVVIAQ